MGVVPESDARIQNIKMRPGTLVSALPALLLLQLQPALLQRSPSTNTNTRLFTGYQALDSGALGFGLGVGAAGLGSGLLNGVASNSNNNYYNPCGKRRRRAAQNSKDTRFFLGGGGGNNCNYPSYPSNSYPSNSYPSNYNNTGSCRCTSLSWTDHYGNVNGNCQSYDS